MRALVLHSENELPRLEDVPQPKPTRGELLIKVSASGMNFADTMMRRGVYLQKPKFPFIPGFEFSGVVETTGDRVMGMCSSGYAEYVTVPAAQVMPVPPHFSDEEAAAFPVTYLTAMGMLRLNGNAQAGETVLIHAAAGGVGTAATQLAKALGLRVIGTASTEEKLALARQQGADVGINYKTGDWTVPVMEATANRGVDIVLESVGGDSLGRDIQVIAPFGRIIVFGSAGGPSPDPPTGALIKNSAGVSAFWMATLMKEPRRLGAVLQELLALVAKANLRPVIGRVYPLAEGATAMQDLESRRTMGKLLLKPA